MNNITNRYILVGTSHISTESKTRILKSFSEFKPDIIAIELDKQRYHAMLSKEKPKIGISAIRQIGLTGYIFAAIGRLIQKKMGNIAGMNPGEEMLLGANLAKNNKLSLALIDIDVAITLKNLSKKVKLSEKLRMVWDVLASPFSRQTKISIDISKIPPDELIAQLLTQMSSRYPGFYRVLLDDRNRYMAKKIYLMLKQDPNKKVLAIVGAGHVEGIKKHIDSLISSNVY